MNILRNGFLPWRLLHRLLDTTIILIVTAFFYHYSPHKELIKLLGIYGTIFSIFIFSFFNLYRSWRHRHIASQIRSVLLSWLSVILFLNFFVLIISTQQQRLLLKPYFLFQIRDFNLWASAILIGLVLSRFAIKRTLTVLREKGYNQKRAVIVGVGEAGLKLASYIDENKWMGIRLEGFFSDERRDHTGTTLPPEFKGKLLGSLDTCVTYVFKHRIDIVFLSLRLRSEKRLAKLLWALGTGGVKVFWVPDILTLGILRAKSHQIGDLNMLDFDLFPAWKRPFDILFSAFIIILTFPLWILIMILIKIEDGGPVIYRAKRIRENGRSFDCLKFRTMVVDADKQLAALLASDEGYRKAWDTKFKLPNDPRITKTGKILRKTSLDELPQFINVIKGEMSVVGARPIVTEELFDYYKQTALTYCSTKPGITGPWQCGDRNDVCEYGQRVELDINYILDCSLWLDIKIIFKTIWRIIRPKGAY